MVDKLTGLHYPEYCVCGEFINCKGPRIYSGCVFRNVIQITEPRPHPRYRLLFRNLGSLVLCMQDERMIEDGIEVERWVEKYRFEQQQLMNFCSSPITCKFLGCDGTCRTPMLLP